MRQIIAGSATAGVVISLCAYYAGMILKKKTGLALFNPLLLSVVFVIAFLSLFQIDYDSYLNSAEYLSYLLTPATVSLAIPLYKQLETLKKNVAAIAAGIGAGVLTSLSSVLLMSRAFRLSHEEYVTLLPKSITTAIGMGVSEELGGMCDDYSRDDHCHGNTRKYDCGISMQNMPSSKRSFQRTCHRSGQSCHWNRKSHGDGGRGGRNEQPCDRYVGIVYRDRSHGVCRLLLERDRDYGTFQSIF